jgi:tRNA A-37 threonylcarbamoyl transferase component Bud32
MSNHTNSLYQGNIDLEQGTQQEKDYPAYYYNQKTLPTCPSNHRASSASTLSDTMLWGEPPYDIERTNCIPGYGPFDITHFKDDEASASSRSPSPINSFEEDEDIFGTKQSHTPSSSGDSGYGTTTRRKRSSSSVTTITKKELMNHKVQDLFEALFAPVAVPQPPTLKIHPKTSASHTGNSSKLSLLFSKSRAQQQHKKKEPHYVKFQTWSTNNSSNAQKACSTTSTPLGSIRRPHEEKLLRSQPHFNSEWHQTNVLPPTIKVQEKKAPRPRRRTDASLLRATPELVLPTIVTALPPPPPPPITTKHTRCRSIGSTLDPPLMHMKTPTPNASVSLSSQMDSHNSLELYDQDGNLMARYKLGNVIGKGHFGTVYRALDLISGKTVAIKQISLKDARKSDIEDMMQEASLLSSLTHTNIVKYEGFIQTQEHMHIVLEFVENGSLLHTLKHFGNELPEHLVATYCHDILQGLAYLHQRDVVHCDLKAANILTTKTGDVKLSDFGVSLNLKLKNHEENLVSGTPFWSMYD